MIEWKLETREISEIMPNEKNPRRLSKRQKEELDVSLKKFGLCQPLVVTEEGKLLGGHQRLRSLRALGRTSVDVYVPTSALTEGEEEELTIRLNKNQGDWDFDLLANHWEPEKLCEWGFSMEELHLEQLPEAEEKPRKFAINISCSDQDQLELIEKQIANIVQDFSGARYKVKVK